MKDFFKTKTWLIMILMIIIAFSFSTAIVYYEFIFKKNIKFTSAGIDDNVFDWAWNSNIGWISFNCASNVDTNGDGLGDQALKICNAGGADQNKVCNTGVIGAAVCPGSCEDACSIHDYGVSIDGASGNISGYAWSSNVGWISFNRSDTGKPPGKPFEKDTDTILADYNKGNDQVRGWAKILSMGDDGWIKLRNFANDQADNGAKIDYGVSIEPASGELKGWAWNANNNGSGIGWISFNCANDNSCGNVNYQVVKNTPPTAIDLTAPNWNYLEAASGGALYAKLGWTFSDVDAGNTQTRYQVIVKKKTDNSTVYDSGKCLGANNCEGSSCDPDYCKVNNGPAGTTLFPLSEPDGLAYNTAYYWWVQVWDNHNVASPLTQYNATQDVPLQADDGAALTFTTYKHEFPDASPTCFPAKPSRGELVRCTANSQRYFSAPKVQTAAEACTKDTCDWLWTKPSGAEFAPGFGPENNAATSTPIFIFNEVGLSGLTLRVTDKNDTGAEPYPYYDEFNITLEVNEKLPQWKEVKPE